MYWGLWTWFCIGLCKDYRVDYVFDFALWFKPSVFFFGFEVELGQNLHFFRNSIYWDFPFLVSKSGIAQPLGSGPPTFKTTFFEKIPGPTFIWINFCISLYLHIYRYTYVYILYVYYVITIQQHSNFHTAVSWMMYPSCVMRPSRCLKVGAQDPRWSCRWERRTCCFSTGLWGAAGWVGWRSQEVNKWLRYL